MNNKLGLPDKFFELPTYGKNLYILCKYATKINGYLSDNRKDLATILGVDVGLAMLAVQYCVEKGLIVKESNKLFVR